MAKYTWKRIPWLLMYHFLYQKLIVKSLGKAILSNSLAGIMLKMHLQIYFETAYAVQYSEKRF